MVTFWSDAEVCHDTLLERGQTPTMTDALLAGIGEELRRIAGALEKEN